MDTGICTPDRPQQHDDASAKAPTKADQEQAMRAIGFIEQPDGTWRYEPHRP